MLAGLNGTSAAFRSNQFDWRVVVDYQWTDDLMTYLQASTGYKGGGINPRPFYREPGAAVQSGDADHL